MVVLAVISCEDAPRWQDALQLWTAVLADSEAVAAGSEEWIEFNAPKQQLPTEQQLASIDGIVLTGSHYSVRDLLTTPWMQELAELIRACVARGRPNIAGSCFGHQLIAAALGGRVDFNTAGREFVLGRERIELTGSGHALMQSLATLAPLSLLQSHEDGVHELPPRAQLLGHSKTSANEMFAVGGNIFSFQFHPELDLAILDDRIASRVLASGRITEQAHREILEDIAGHKLHSSEFNVELKRFLCNGWAQ
eukprot:m.630133 g.630133  ORF g.630133 m.630133 type:complete len:252 (-) comp58277_c0_seq7:121-876(-)